MKTTMTLSVDQNLKESFGLFAKSLGTNPTNLINMMMKNIIVTRKITFISSPDFDMDIETFDKNQIESLENNKNIQNNTNKLDKLLVNL